MPRVFEKGSSSSIEDMVLRFLVKLPTVTTQSQFDRRHHGFCRSFIAKVRLAKDRGRGRQASCGHAAKVLDVALKVCVDFCQLPDEKTAPRVRPFLHAAIDTPVLRSLKKTERLAIEATSVQEIDRGCYQLLQAAVARQIASELGDEILPVEWDNIMWRRLSRE